MEKDWSKEKITDGSIVIACIIAVRPGLKSGWDYKTYKASKEPYDGYRIVKLVKGGFYPCKEHFQECLKLESEWEAAGTLVIRGKPKQGFNAPKVV